MNKMKNVLPSWEKVRPEVKPVTGIIMTDELTWEVWYKSVQFAELEELKEAHDRLQKLLALDTTK
jgi:hypothetical protein